MFKAELESHLGIWGRKCRWWRTRTVLRLVWRSLTLNVCHSSPLAYGLDWCWFIVVALGLKAIGMVDSKREGYEVGGEVASGEPACSSDAGAGRSAV